MDSRARTPQSGRTWDSRLRRHFRRGCDEGSGSIISYVAGASVFLVSSAFLFSFAIDPPQGGITNLQHQGLKTKAAQALNVILGTPGYPYDWADSAAGVESLSATGRLGLLEQGSSIRLDAAKFEALAKGRYSSSSATNGYVDYAEAKEALGLDGYDFRLSGRLVASGETDATFGLGGSLTDYRIGYIGDFSGALPSSASKSEAYVLDQLPVRFTNVTRTTAIGTGDVYPDDAATLKSALIPAIGTSAAQTIIQGPSSGYDFAHVAPGVYSSLVIGSSTLTNALALTDGAGQLGYTKGREIRALLGAADLTGLTSAVLTWKEWVDTDRGNFSYDPGDYGFVEVSTDGGATWVAVTGSGTLSAASRDTSTSPHPALLVERTVTLSAAACAGCPNNPSVLVALHWVADNDNTIGYGWVVDDVSLSPTSTTGLHATFESPEYDLLVVGSDVAHNALTSTAVKEAIRDFVDVHGGRLVVLGGEQNTNWLVPLFQAGEKGGASDVETPDVTHPVLTVPNEVDWESFPTGSRVWSFPNDDEDLFNAVITSGDDHVLSVSAPGAFGDGDEGEVILTTYRAYEMTGDEPFAFLANALSYGQFRHSYLEMGPDVPVDIPIASASRTATMDRSADGSGDYVEIAFTLFVWPGGGEIPADPPVPRVPGAPQSLAATAGNEQVGLTWTLPVDHQASHLTGYTVRRGTAPGAVDTVVAPLLAATATSWTDTSADLQNGVTYYYTVTARNGTGDGTTPGAVSATPRTTPGAPAGITVVGLVDENRVSWTAPADNGGALVTGYRVRWNLTGDATTHDVELGSTTEYYHTALGDGVRRCYRVFALNDAGPGPASGLECGAPLLGPDAPTGFAATTGALAGVVELAWGPPANLSGGTLTGYEIEVGTDGTSYTPLAALGAANVSFTHGGLGASALRFYRIHATTSVGDGAYAASSAATQPPPGPPATFAAAQGVLAGTNTLAWTAPTQLNGTTLTGYKVWAGQTSGSLVLLATLTNATDAGWTHAGLSASATWYYQVQATTTGEDGTLYAEQSATTLPPPEAVASFSASRGAAPGAIDLAWTPPLVTNGATLTGYKIYSGPSSASLTLLATLPSAANTSFAHLGLATNQTVHYKIAARSDVGDGTNSSAASAVTQSVPMPPATLTGTAPVLGATTLTWTAPSDTGGAGTITYKLYRGNAWGSQTDLLYSGSLLSYTHTAYSASKKYYTVVAVNSLGPSGGTTYQYS